MYIDWSVMWFKIGIIVIGVIIMVVGCFATIKVVEGLEEWRRKK